MKETKKQIKAQLTNEIAKQYAKREASLKERICFLEERQIRANSRIAELEKENIEDYWMPIELPEEEHYESYD